MAEGPMASTAACVSTSVQRQSIAAPTKSDVREAYLIR